MHNWPALPLMVMPWISVFLGCLFRTELGSFVMTRNNSQNRDNLKRPGRALFSENCGENPEYGVFYL